LLRPPGFAFAKYNTQRSGSMLMTGTGAAPMLAKAHALMPSVDAQGC